MQTLAAKRSELIDWRPVRANQLNMTVDPDVMEYVTSTSHHDQLMKTLAAKKSEIDWKPNDKMAVVVYRGEDKDTWQLETIEEIQNYLGKFTTLQVEIEREFWEAVKTQLSSIRACFGVDPPLIKTIDDAFVTKLVCLTSDAKTFEDQLKEKLEEIYDAETRKNILTKERLILLKMKFKLQEINEEVEVKLEPEADGTNSEGSHSVKAKVKFNKLTLDVVEKKLNLSKRILEVLGSDQAQQTVKLELEKNKVEAIFTIDKEASVVGTSSWQADEAASLVNKLTLEEKVPVADEDQYLLKTPEWRQQYEELNTKETICVYQKNGSDTLVAGFREDVKDAIKKLSAYIEKHSIRTEQFTCPLKLFRRYLSELRQEDLRSIETQLTEFEVKIQNGNGDDEFVIRGKKEGLQRARGELNNLLVGLKSETFDLQQPGLKKFFSSEKGNRLIKSIERDNACVIDAQTSFGKKPDDISTQATETADDLSDETGDESGLSYDDDDDCDDDVDEEEAEEEEAIVSKTGPLSLGTANGQSISWKAGKIETEKAEILVSSKGACSEAIIGAAGQAMKVKHPKPGEITVTPGYNLACSHVIHTTCCEWNGGKSETVLQDTVEKCLRKGQELGVKSIAFPVIGTGNLHFPPDEASRIMLEEVIRYCLKNPLSTVKDIRFVLNEENSALVSAFQQEMANVRSRQKLSKRKFRPGYAMRDLMSNLRSKLGGGMPVNPGCHVNVQVVQGDLCKESSDAIVNINNPDMNMANAGGLSKAILEATGTAVQDECNRLGPQAGGSVMLTTGGNLAARGVRYIIHLIPYSSSMGQLQKCVEKCLKVAEARGFQTISFPAVGTGCKGLCMSATDSASLMFQALSNFSAHSTTIRNVRIVLLQSQMLPAFQQEQQKHPQLSNRSITLKRITKAKGLSIEVIKGDLTQEKTDAIMNINSTDMDMNKAGVLSKAILKGGGLQLQQECSQLGQQTPGSAVMTSGGSLAVKHIIHIIPGSADKQNLQTCLEAGLRLADTNNFRSISIPCVGTGSFGLNGAESAQLTFQALEKFHENCKSIRKVRIVVFQDGMMQDFVQALQTHAVEQDADEPDSDSSSNCAVAGQLRKRRSRRRAANDYCLKIRVVGSDKAKVQKAVDSLKEGFSESIMSHEVEDETISRLSQKQVDALTRQAEERDVKLGIEVHLERITLQGEPSEVMGMVGEIWGQIKERNKKIQEEEKAMLVSKNVEWSYKRDGAKTVIDPNTSKKIEEASSKGKDAVKVSLGGEEFDLNLKEKTGRSRKKGKKGQHIKLKLSRKVKLMEEGIPLPKDWAPMPRPEMTVHPVTLAPGSREYQNVLKKVKDTASSINIQKIERVQNPHLYQSYMVRKEKMDRDNRGTNERQLFHGTKAQNVAAINIQGFNRSLCGVHGTVFGQGVYFARDASYSAKYAGGGTRQMYLARVLVGKYCKGDPSMKIPPPKTPSIPQILYESVVDNPVNPSVFVVFFDNQCYPEYLITFL